MQKIWLIAVLVFAVACKKDSPDTQAPNIVFNEPTNGEIFAPGAPIHIEAEVVDNERIDEIHLTVINKATNDEVVHTHSAPTGATYLVNNTFIAVADLTYIITIDAYDAAGNSSNKTIEVTVE